MTKRKSLWKTLSKNIHADTSSVVQYSGLQEEKAVTVKDIHGKLLQRRRTHELQSVCW